MNEELEYFKLPIYPVLYKETLLMGIPMNMAAINIGGVAMGLIVLKSFSICFLFILIHLFIFIMIKVSKKFDTKLLDILVRKNLKKYISY
ncbi:MULTISPECIES: VirB3 family type IV secretion system protein [unclassified Fusobacterium]|uniref:VirB3 family type IV secretion system protein n=1 Tax=unclassified Fusobacterium TaxID=2648384 RepID=UPI001B8B1B1B|nr:MULTISPECIES: VirB3 family type IV secretion system protein [unclassified Fusobacterium]MBR8700495.1 hypothetical protein [Fusobacterium sp. DD45]MBR8710240.1 hypothetical protein [Fusobacterium sp. DD28]MBR8750762.1 hypothetical protein [Fusobacterium sp. DD26]